MSWLPGVGPIKDVSAVGVSRGLSEDWYSDTASVGEIKKGDFWDIIDNPLYQVAAEAKGYNWAEWIENAKGKVGHGPGDWVRAEVKAATSGSTQAQSGGPNANIQYTTTPGSPAKYEWMPKEEAKDKGYSYTEGPTKRWKNKKTGEISTTGNPYLKGQGDHRFGRGIEKLSEEWEDEWKELRDWGVHDEDVAEDLDEIGKWLHEIVSINDHLPRRIREGPQGYHYGIEGDIWEHYGLDKEPEPPKELDWDSAEKDMQLATIVTSDVGYSTPEGITPVDLHGD